MKKCLVSSAGFITLRGLVAVHELIRSSKGHPSSKYLLRIQPQGEKDEVQIVRIQSPFFFISVKILMLKGPYPSAM